MQNTPNKKSTNSSISKQQALIKSLNKQPLIIVVRLEKDFFDIPGKKKLLFSKIKNLSDSGIRHIEIGWDPNSEWGQIVS